MQHAIDGLFVILVMLYASTLIEVGQLRRKVRRLQHPTNRVARWYVDHPPR